MTARNIKAYFTKKRLFNGKYSSVFLLSLYIFLEIIFAKIGGNTAAFLYVTFHFIIMPLIAILVLILTTRQISRANTITAKLLLLSSLAIPMMVLYIAVTGDTTLPKILNVDFNR